MGHGYEKMYKNEIQSEPSLRYFLKWSHTRLFPFPDLPSYPSSGSRYIKLMTIVPIVFFISVKKILRNFREIVFMS